MSDDLVWLLVSFCEFPTILAWRATSRRNFTIVASVLRSRYRGLVQPFVPNVHAFSEALRRHGAVLSGSVALYYFIPCDNWFPNDLDVYVSYDEFPAFVRTLQDDPALQFKMLPTLEGVQLSTSLSLDVAEIKKLSTPSHRVVDIIRSRRSTPVSPLIQFWTSMLVNFVTPDVCVAAFPRMVFNGRGFVKEFGMSSRNEAAMRKYTSRDFQPGKKFAFVPELWGTWKDPSYWQRDYFSDRGALVIDFRSRVHDSMPLLPIRPSSAGWGLVIPFPGSVLCCSCFLFVHLLTLDLVR